MQNPSIVTPPPPIPRRGSTATRRIGVLGAVVSLLAGLLLLGAAPGSAVEVVPPPTPTPSPSPTEEPSSPPPSTDPEDRGPTAPGATPLPPPGTPSAAGQTCFLVLDKVTPGERDSDVVASGCRATTITTPPVVPGDPVAPGQPTTGGPTRLRQQPAPTAAAADPAIPIMELYANTNYGGRSFIVYGHQGPCDGGPGYVISDATNPNSTVGGISSSRSYNNCSTEKFHNQTDLRGTPASYFGPNVPSLPAAYDNRVYSVAIRASCTTYPQTGRNTCGLIREKYEALGGPTGPLGPPTSNELTNPDNIGKRNTFQNQNAPIYWSPASGANAIQGAIFQKWSQLGYEAGALGYPKSDEAPTSDNRGRQNAFLKSPTYGASTSAPANGSIIWSTASGAHELRGPIRELYLEMRDVRSCHRYPTSDTQSNSLGQWVNFTGNSGTQISVSGQGSVFSSCANDSSLPRGGVWNTATPPSGPQRFSVPTFNLRASQPPAGSVIRPIEKNCPPNTETYPNPTYPNIEPAYSCDRIYTDNANGTGPGGGYDVGIRTGRPGPLGSGAFGLIHFTQDHNVSPEAVGTTIANNAAGQQRDDGRFVYGIVYANPVTGQVIATLEVIVDKQRSFDGFDFGVVTAYCVGPTRCPPGLDATIEENYVG